MTKLHPVPGWAFSSGEMAERIRTHDWASTALGPIEAWPERLKVIVEMALANPAVSMVVCGPERLLIYNDAAANLYGERHPAALGRPLFASFPEIFAVAAPFIERAFAGEAVHVDSQQLAWCGGGDMHVFNACLTPVRNEAGEVGYVYSVNCGMTEHRAAAQLEATKEGLLALLRAGGVMFFRLDASWTRLLEAHGQAVFPDTCSPTERWLDRYVPAADQPRVVAALKEATRAKSTYELEHQAWRVDGRVGWVVSRAAPLFDDKGEIREWFGATIDITARKEAEARLREREEHFRLMADAVPHMVWVMDAKGSMEFHNEQWQIYTGQSRRPRTANEGVANVIHPADRAAVTASFAAARRAGTSWAGELRMRRASGDYRWVLVRAEPYRDPETGEILRWYGATIDIHDLRQFQETQQLLIAELQHRTRNLLAIVNSMARQTERTSGSPEAFFPSFYDRLAALSRVQALLSRESGETVTLRELVEAELKARAGDDGGQRISLSGPDVQLYSKAVQVLALALHELATNATKHGALGQEQAKLSVDWSLSSEGGQEFVSVNWVETGVELAEEAPGKPRGFGRQLIEQALPYDLHAETSWTLTADGIRCTLKVPLR